MVLPVDPIQDLVDKAERLGLVQQPDPVEPGATYEVQLAHAVKHLAIVAALAQRTGQPNRAHAMLTAACHLVVEEGVIPALNELGEFVLVRHLGDFIAAELDAMESAAAERKRP